MQTFLPYRNFSESAKALDNKRLFKQCVECLQIVNIIWRKRGWIPLEYKDGKPRKGFWNHPAVCMWEAHPRMLLAYWDDCVVEAEKRGFKMLNIRTKKYKLYNIWLNKNDEPGLGLMYSPIYDIPKWLTDEFCRSHQSNLVRKDPSYYLFDVPNNLPYIWPKL